MASYLVTGVSRGLGLAFIRQLSQDPTSTVIGLVRDKAKAEKILDSELKRDNVKLVQGDLSDYASLVGAVKEVSNITRGKLDYLIENAALLPELSALTTMDKLAGQPEDLEKELMESFRVNVVGNIHLVNLCLPLLRRSDVRKVAAITTAMADLDFLARYDAGFAGPYTISKGALNAVSPGVVATALPDNLSEEQQEGLRRLKQGVLAYAPNFSGPSTPEEAARRVLSVIHDTKFEAGDSGSFVSHFGNKQWV
ncbi:hypothetical protein DL766_005426 [Monosporascus sp. MC13-8B]|uniref:Ketoreductase (KR) domain-containing protein n=1 Tax=Monosporascus cannonballus TaxID=155416 RepID=A0ABY0GS38_9PEZI|nr:hypothetical protein DL762_009880 [Monosporascus cannonballus]RYO96761.1 hypothetical protein DL763_003037 [Monosporascus cannonballus]RYP29329.1 hypothetical protein DL766_005426 [Monosporascus sp. MC13-8B]